MPDLSEDLVMKARAWVDNFWSRLQPMQKYTETFEMFDHFDQGDEHAIECGFGTAGTVMTFNRFYWYGCKITRQALLFLSSRVIKTPGDISMLAAIIIHRHTKSGNEFVTYKWLKTLFDGKGFTDETLSEMWQAQKINTGDSTGNLVDLRFAFLS